MGEVLIQLVHQIEALEFEARQRWVLRKKLQLIEEVKVPEDAPYRVWEEGKFGREWEKECMKEKKESLVEGKKNVYWGRGGGKIDEFGGDQWEKGSLVMGKKGSLGWERECDGGKEREFGGGDQVKFRGRGEDEFVWEGKKKFGDE